MRIGVVCSLHGHYPTAEAQIAYHHGRWEKGARLCPLRNRHEADGHGGHPDEPDQHNAESFVGHLLLHRIHNGNGFRSPNMDGDAGEEGNADKHRATDYQRQKPGTKKNKEGSTTRCCSSSTTRCCSTTRAVRPHIAHDEQQHVSCSYVAGNHSPPITEKMRT